MERRSRPPQLPRGVLREVNDKMYEALANYQTFSKGGAFICECGRATCDEKIHLELEQYKVLRRQRGEASLVKREHIREDDEIVVPVGDFVFVAPSSGEGGLDIGRSTESAER